MDTRGFGKRDFPYGVNGVMTGDARREWTASGADTVRVELKLL